MARRKVIKADSLGGLWKRLDDSVPPYLSTSRGPKRAQAIKGLESVLAEVNASSLPESIAGNVLRPYFTDKAISILFDKTGDRLFGENAVLIDLDSEMATIDPVGIYLFHQELVAAAEKLEGLDPEKEYNFYRHLAFCHELSKLPRQYLVFLLILREVAISSRIVSVERRDGGYSESDSPEYLSLLWAFKEFELFYRSIQHRDVRSDFGVIWHEGQWIETVKKR